MFGDTHLERVADAIVDVVSGSAEFFSETTHRSHDEVEALDVPPASSDLFRRLDHQDPVSRR